MFSEDFDKMTNQGIENSVTINFDTVITNIGGFGLYQKRLMLSSFYMYIIYAFSSMIPVFILGKHDYRCTTELNVTSLNITSHSTLSESDCYVQSYDNRTNITSSMKCSTWLFDPEDKISTPISDFYLVCDKVIMKSHINMAFYFGMLLSALVGGPSADLFGRKPVSCIILFFICIPHVCIAWTSNDYTFAVLRFLSGIGCYAGPLKLLVVEMVGPKWRSFVVNMHQVVFAVGEIILCGLAFLIRDWRIVQLVISLPSAVCLFYGFLLPESVRWLHGHGKVAETNATLQRIAAVNKTTENLPSDILIQAGEQKLQFGEFHQLVKIPKLTYRWIIIGFISFVLGILYTGLSLNIGTLEGDVYISFLACVIAEMFGLLILVLIGNRVGRKYQHVIGFSVAAGLSAISVSARIYAFTKAGTWISVIAAVLVRMLAAAGTGTIFTYSSELFPTSTRNIIISSVYVAYTIGSMAAPYIVNLDEIFDVSFSKVLPAVVFGMASLTAGLFCFTLPETLYRALPQRISDVTNQTIRDVTTSNND